MKFSVLAVDYDGTIAQDDVLEPVVKAAVAELRARDVAVVLATGRRLDDLERVAGDLHFVDAVVAENGAVLWFPASGYSAVLGQPPPPRLFEELRRQGVRFAAGRSVVEADASDAPAIFGVLQRHELPLSMIFNRSRVMVLPQNVSKATGLREVLTMLRLSRHNTVAIGDAENDHALLQTAEFGVAVGWGSEFLKSSADHVLPGTGPAAVAAFIRELGHRQHLPVSTVTRHVLRLGHGDDGRPFQLSVRGRNVLIAGDPKSGKSWAAGLLCEQLILQGYCLCILDAEGDYVSLESLPGVVVFGGADPLPRPREIVRTLRHPDVSIVIDLSHTSYAEKTEFLNAALPAVAVLRRQTGLPHRIVVDEAHQFLHGQEANKLLDLELNGYTLVTYRASQLDPRILAASEAVVVTRESDPREVRALFDLCASCVSAGQSGMWQHVLGSMALGDAVVLPITAEAGGEMRRIRLAPRLTPHVRHEAKYVDLPVPHGRGFVFWSGGQPTGPRVHSLRDFVAVLDRVDPATIDGHLRRGDFSRWVADVFGDYPLARTIQRLEAQYCSGARPRVGREIVEAVRQRYRLSDDFSSPSSAPPAGQPVQ